MFEFNEPYEWIAKVAWLFVILGTIALLSEQYNLQ